MAYDITVGPSRDEVRTLLHLRALPGLGDVRLRRLLDRYGTPSAVLSAPASALGVDAARARHTRQILGRVERSLRTIDRLGVRILTESAVGYPPGLRHLYDPPFLLFARGRLDLLERPSIAIVGARRHTVYGSRSAATFAAELARAGFTIISGLARGIDGTAHEAALAAGADGCTIGVLGSGIDVPYPREHTGLFNRIAEEGLLVSEFLPGEPATRYNFPRRNRIIAALSNGVLVVEAARRSGALITADHALDLGIDVFAVPGPIDRATSEGPNHLIREGAVLVRNVADIAAELKSSGARAPADEDDTQDERPHGVAVPPAGLTGELLDLWQRLESEPLHVDELASACAINTSSALIALLELELRGHAQQLNGMRFIRVETRPSKRRGKRSGKRSGKPTSV